MTKTVIFFTVSFKTEAAKFDKGLHEYYSNNAFGLEILFAPFITVCSPFDSG